VAFTVALAIANPSEPFLLLLRFASYLGFGVVKTNLDVTRLAERVKNVRPRADGDTSAEDARLSKYFQLLELGQADMPTLVLDIHGRIMVWYLPRIFSLNRVVCWSSVSSKC
jgi:hypothetical protein